MDCVGKEHTIFTKSCFMGFMMYIRNVHLISYLIYASFIIFLPLKLPKFFLASSFNLL